MRLEQLTFTRFIAAVLVIFFHHFRKSEFFSHANLFVSYFYILSGFVLVISQHQSFSSTKEYSTFYINRLARIYPIFLLSTLLIVLINQHVSWDILLNIFGIQAFVPEKALNYNMPSWSISVELFFYACFPLLVRYFYNKFSMNAVLWCSLAFWLVCQVIFMIYYFLEPVQPDPFLHYNPVNHINAFIIGGAAAKLFEKLEKTKGGNYDLALLIISALIFFYISYSKRFFTAFDHNGLLAIFFVPFILLLALNTGYLTKVFSHKLLVLAGNISFGIYILAEPTFIGVNKLSVTWGLPRLGYFHYTLAILFIVSYLVYVFFEKPFQTAIKSFGLPRKITRRSKESKL